MIYLVGNGPEWQGEVYTPNRFVNLMAWLRHQRRKQVQLDIETNVTNYWCTKEIRTVQFGGDDGKDQWVVQWLILTDEQRQELKTALEDWEITWIIHNAMFECVVFLFHGIRLRKVWCTMLAEMILWCGIHTQDDQEMEENETNKDASFFSLAQTHYRYYGTNIDKTEQMNFGDNILTVSKIKYAAGDVRPLGAIRKWQMMELSAKDLEWVAALEMEAVLGYAEMTFHGMELDTEKWLANLELALPVQADAKKELDRMLADPTEPFRKKATELGYYHPRDRVTINWNAPKQKQDIVARFFPFLIDRCGKPALERLVRDHQKGKCIQHPAVVEWAGAFLEGATKKIEEALIETDRQWLIDNEYLIPADSVTINWGAWQQTLPVFQAADPKLKGTSKKDMGMFLHPIAAKFKTWRDSMKLTTTYGAKFIEDNLEPDGKIRPSINQIVSTGRISMYGPNMQQIPAREPIGNRYLNCFVAPPGWGYVCSDFIGQEMVITAYLSNEKVWNEALKKRQDLHSVCAELISEKEWKAAAGKDCEYYREDYWCETLQKWASDYNALVYQSEYSWIKQPRKTKCKCKAHKAIREPIKNMDFGIIYGMSKFKMAGDMKWPIKRAEEEIAKYFRKFPSLRSTLNTYAWFGLTEGYIQTIAPFFRKRYFPDVKEYTPAQIKFHWEDIKYDKRLGEIERAAKNMPIQGTGAECVKLAMVMLYWELHDGPVDLSDKAYLVLQVHDANDTIARDDFAEEWAATLDRIMHEAGLFIIPNGLLRAETTRSAVWTK